MVESAAVTVKAVIFEPWLLVGAVKVTTEAALAPVVADTPVGAFGAPATATAAEAADAWLLPEALVATTVKV